ncbi:hypothetical protein Pint_20432 [Pistacia integerrima]|uniref:Uncharacterized protein n=1 Tax=Pistacia integerrima TaxID=434235 RepID=A0ACC0XAX6_9ROSI|nr:hypothetical protein Pint_20432 [Pistacia integerrima]
MIQMLGESFTIVTQLASSSRDFYFTFLVLLSDCHPLMQERRYLLKEFPELVSCGESSKLLEVGCGNGSTILPILR